VGRRLKFGGYSIKNFPFSYFLKNIFILTPTHLSGHTRKDDGNQTIDQDCLILLSKLFYKIIDRDSVCNRSELYPKAISSSY
jgi:hypothetical protein